MKSRVYEKMGDSKIKVNVETSRLIDKKSTSCLKKKQDCLILDSDPNDSLRYTSIFNNNNNSSVSIFAEKGQVACRDFPHSRHNCAKYPFTKTNHESYCQQCYCFVCDKVAPCIMWTGSNGHCHAINNEAWKLYRKGMQGIHRAEKAIEGVKIAMNNKSLKLQREAIQEFCEASQELLKSLK